MRKVFYMLFAILFTFIMALAGCGEDEDGGSGVVISTVSQGESKPRSRDKAVPEIDNYKDIEDFIEDLRDAGRSDIADAWALKIKGAKDVVARFGVGYVIVGRVVVDGPEDPREVRAQMEILEEGYFAGPVKNLTLPVGFRLSGYAPFDLELRDKKGKSGFVINVGTIHITPLPAGDSAGLCGKVIPDEGIDPATTEVTLSITCGPINTPHGGIEGRSYWPEPIKLRILPSGEFSIDGLTPTEYYVLFSDPKHVDKAFRVNLKPGETLDLGTMRLETPKQIKLAYYVSNEPIFDRVKEKQVTIDAGNRWEASGDMLWGWDLEFKQEDDKISFNCSYWPCYMADLGTGNIKEFLDPDIGDSQFVIPNVLEPKHGHIYLLNQQCFNHWVLFKLEINE